ncbi:MAG: hypothetical protein ACXW2P_12825, partial [Thermoanaerobaculia bacterium]
EVKVGGRLHEVITDLVPREGHRTPALRPGVRRLLVARSGRRASLRFQGVGWMRGRAVAVAWFSVPQPRQVA